MTLRNERTIAILLAVYNGERYLPEQIDSLLAQTCRDWTLYIRDDASTDSTSGIIADYCAAHPGRIVEVRDGLGNLGCCHNFLRLLEVVESDYYMFCDADDVWLPEKVQCSRAELCRQEALHPAMPLLVHCDKVVCDAELNRRAPSWWRAVRLDPGRFLSAPLMALSPTVGGAASIFNRRLREVCFPLPAALPGHDWWTSVQAARLGKVVPLYRSLILYRQHGGNTIGATLRPYRFRFGKLLALKTIYRRDMDRYRYFNSLKIMGGGGFWNSTSTACSCC